MAHGRHSLPPERRSAPRFHSKLLLKFVGDDFEITSTTRNISCSGMYCDIPRHIPIMTKLAVTLVVPLIVNSRKEEYQVCCSAIVVRISPEQEQPRKCMYRIGCFFCDLTPTDHEVILRYIEQAFLAKRN